MDGRNDEERCGVTCLVFYTNPAAYPPLEHSSRILTNCARSWATGAPGDGPDGPVFRLLCVVWLPSYASEASYRANPTTVADARWWSSAEAEPLETPHSRAVA